MAKRKIKTIKGVERFYKKIQKNNNLLIKVFENDDLDCSTFDEMLEIAIMGESNYSYSSTSYRYSLVSDRRMYTAIITHPNFNQNHLKQLMNTKLANDYNFIKAILFFQLEIVKQNYSLDRLLSWKKNFPAAANWIIELDDKLEHRYTTEKRPRWTNSYKRPSALVNQLMEDYRDVKQVLSSGENTVGALSNDKLVRKASLRSIAED